MRRSGVLALLASLLALVVACGSDDPTGLGEMSDATYRSLEVRDDLTTGEAEKEGAIRSDELARTFESAGGSPAADGLSCRYARVLHLESNEERGTARFCFDDQRQVVSVGLEDHSPR